MIYIRAQISVDIDDRQRIETDILNRDNLIVEIEPRLELTVDIVTRQDLEVVVETLGNEDGYYASVKDETLHLLKRVNVTGSELVLNE